MHEPLTYAESIVIAATPEAVYDVVSDVTRTGEWSTVCRECWWDEGDGPRVGAFFTGRNQTPERTWETRCEVVAAEPGQRFGWAVNGGRVLWTYLLRPVSQGTELTESWEFTAVGLEHFLRRYGSDGPAEIAAREHDAHRAIPEGLAAIKRIVEAEAG